MSDDIIQALIKKFHAGVLIGSVVEPMIVCQINPSNVSRVMEGGLPSEIKDTLIRWSAAPN